MVVDEDPGASIDVSEDGGVTKVIKKEGSGTDTPCEGSTVYVHYVGTLLDGEEFDSSRKRGKPFDFVLGSGQVIQAWELGVETMKKGEICMLTCKPEFAYGRQGRPPTIPENATLVFEVELLYWSYEKVTMDELVSKRILKKGSGTENVGDGGTVDVHLIGKDGDRVFDERDVKFTVGEGGECDVIPGVDVAVTKMKKDEVALITADSSHAFGEKGRPEWNIAPNVTVKYEVHLKSFEKLKEPWEFTSEERIEGAKAVKAKGAQYFKQEKYSLALGNFTRLVALVESLATDKDLKEAAPLILAGHLNMALCYLKLGKFIECICSCDKVLDREQNNIKALYRKARAQLSLQYLDEAKKLFEKVLQLDPKNKDARTYYLATRKKLDEHREKEKKVFANMFDKFAATDAKNTARNKEQEFPDGKDVFARAEDEARKAEDGATKDEDGATKDEDGATKDEDGATKDEDGATKAEDEAGKAEDEAGMAEEEAGMAEEETTNSEGLAANAIDEEKAQTVNDVATNKPDGETVENKTVDSCKQAEAFGITAKDEEAGGLEKETA